MIPVLVGSGFVLPGWIHQASTVRDATGMGRVGSEPPPHVDGGGSPGRSWRVELVVVPRQKPGSALADGDTLRRRHRNQRALGGVVIARQAGGRRAGARQLPDPVAVSNAVVVAAPARSVMAVEAVRTTSATETEEERRLAYLDDGAHRRRPLDADLAGGFPLLDLLGEGGADGRVDSGLVGPQLARQRRDKTVVGLRSPRL